MRNQNIIWASTAWEVTRVGVDRPYALYYVEHFAYAEAAEKAMWGEAVQVTPFTQISWAHDYPTPFGEPQ